MIEAADLYARSAAAAAAARREVARSLHLRTVLAIARTGHLPDGDGRRGRRAARCPYCGAEPPCSLHTDLADLDEYAQ